MPMHLAPVDAICCGLNVLTLDTLKLLYHNKKVSDKDH